MSCLKKENLALLVLLTTFCQAVKADTTTSTTASANTSPATVLTKSDGSVETIWWVPSITNSYWTPEWWSEYTAAGGKLASVSTTTTESDSTSTSSPSTSTSTSSASTSSATTSYPGTTTTGSAYVSGDANGHTTITPIIDIYTTTGSNGKTETVSSTISTGTSTSTRTSASVVSSGGANLGVVAMLNEQQGSSWMAVLQTMLMLVVGLV